MDGEGCGGCVLILLFLFVVTWQRQSFGDGRGSKTFFFSFFFSLACTVTPPVSFFPGQGNAMGRLHQGSVVLKYVHQDNLGWGSLCWGEASLKAAPACE